MIGRNIYFEQSGGTDRGTQETENRRPAASSCCLNCSASERRLARKTLLGKLPSPPSVFVKPCLRVLIAPHRLVLCGRTRIDLFLIERRLAQSLLVAPPRTLAVVADSKGTGSKEVMKVLVRVWTLVTELRHSISQLVATVHPVNCTLKGSQGLAQQDPSSKSATLACW